MAFTTFHPAPDGAPIEPVERIPYLPGTVARTAKILVMGPRGVGKTSLIGSVSEFAPLRTEEPLTRDAADPDGTAPDGAYADATDPYAADRYACTDRYALDAPSGEADGSVAMDFGRVTVNERLALYLFGAPGHHRFWKLWAGLAEGAVGVLVLVDTRRLEGSFPVLDQVEAHMPAPFAVAVNHFPDTPHHPLGEVREALDLPPDVPIVDCNALDRTSSIRALVALTGHAIAVRGHDRERDRPHGLGLGHRRGRRRGRTGRRPR